MYEIRCEHWMDVYEECDNKKKMHDLRWEIYVQENNELIKTVPHPKGGNIVWNGVNDNIIDEK